MRFLRVFSFHPIRFGARAMDAMRPEEASLPGSLGARQSRMRAFSSEVDAGLRDENA
jgi:hypothetical protein